MVLLRFVCFLFNILLQNYEDAGLSPRKSSLFFEEITNEIF